MTDVVRKAKGASPPPEYGKGISTLFSVIEEELGNLSPVEREMVNETIT